MKYDARYGQFLVELGKRSGQVAVCEAAHEAYKAFCESRYDTFDETTTHTAAVYLRKPVQAETDPYISLNVPGDVLNEIESVLPDAADQFNSEYSYSGEGVDVSVRSYGEYESWDGRDFGTYDPGYGETECEISGDVGEYVDNLMKHWVEYVEDMFPDEPAETIATKVAKVHELIKPYIATADVY